MPRKRSQWLATLAGAGVVALFGVWFGIRTFPWFGPLVADTLRAIAGSHNVTRLEEVVASVEDRAKQVASSGVAHSLTDSTPAELLAPPASTGEIAARRPKDFEPLFPKVASPEDGVWQPVSVRGSEHSVLHRTIVHPDPARSYAELFVFALDLDNVRVEAVAGSIEPRSPARNATERPGVVPERDRPGLIAAFNGGFKAEHGHYGMMAGGERLLAPNAASCTFAGFGDGTLAIASWPKLDRESDATWWRQTPPCMLENGALHPGLTVANNKKWGATLEGDTVIRRSAVGLSADGKTLFVGISNSTTARALALGMERAGSVSVAQLDVNFSFPRFLLYRDDADTGKLTALGSVKGLLYRPDEFLGAASTRDFFYVALR
ncbi:MAG TPA: phosphodiester glycosidase family protein [Polyangiaceae bacterium]